MWSIHHGHTDIMYVFASPIHLRGCMKCLPVSGSSPSLSCPLSRLRLCGLTSSVCIIISKRGPWLGESERRALTSQPSFRSDALTFNRSCRGSKASEQQYLSQLADGWTRFLIFRKYISHPYFDSRRQPPHWPPSFVCLYIVLLITRGFFYLTHLINFTWFLLYGFTHSFRCKSGQLDAGRLLLSEYQSIWDQ